LNRLLRIVRRFFGNGEIEAPAISGFFGEYRFLSNFWPATVRFEGQVYPTVEHAYQGAKCVDPTMREQIRLAKRPGKAKKLGSKVKPRADWDEVRAEVMRHLVSQKFQRHSELGDQLLATGNAELVEENSWGDTFWGVCEGEGENRLGRILMEVRQELRLSRGR